MRTKSLALVVSLFSATFAHADGCKIALSGRFVPEREQRAMIEWEDGVETLYVATLSDPTTEGSVWVVPIRATATAIKAEPIDEFPVVGYYETLKNSARDQINDWLTITAILNSGGLMCPLIVGGCEDKKSTGSAREVSRTEKLGMVVTVVTAESRAAIEAYLDAQGVNRQAANLSSLDSYFGPKNFGFVCAWVAKTGEPAKATGLKITFPSPTLWFPLRPTRAYSHPITTVVYARGFVKPADGCDLPELRCEYVYGKIEPQSVTRSFAVAERFERFRHYSRGHAQLTRITLTTDPQNWDQDLELVPGTTTTGHANLAITGWASDIGIGWNAIIGALLGLFLPRLTTSRAERTRVDLVGGALTGAAIALSIWASVLVFAIWRSARFRDGLGPPRRYLVLLAFAIVHFLVVLAIYLTLSAFVVGES